MAFFTPPGKAQGSSYRSLFNVPVTRFLASAKNQITGVILPIHDWEYAPGTPEFNVSYKPYRDAAQRDAQGHPALMPIGAFVYVHKNIGRREEDFVSPFGSDLNLFSNGMARSMDDPIIDIINTIRDEKHRWHHLSKDGSGPKGGRLISFPGKMVVMNTFATSSKTPNDPPKVGLLTPSNSALVDYEMQMNVTRPPSLSQPRDIDWPDYLYGDVTNPNHPVLYNTMIRSNPTNSSQTYTGFFFSNNSMSYDGLRPGPVIPKDVLAQRLNIFDPALYNFLVYQELVDLLLADNCYPPDLIQECCSGKANIGGTPALGIQQPMQQATPNWQPAQQAAPVQQGWGQPAQTQQPAAQQWGPAAQQSAAPAQAWGPSTQQAASAQQGWVQQSSQQPAAQAWGNPAGAQPAAQAWGPPAQQQALPAQQGWGQPAADPTGFKTDAWAQPSGLAAELAQPTTFAGVGAPPEEQMLWLIEAGQQPRQVPKSQAVAIAMLKPGQVGVCLTGPQGPFVTPESVGLIDAAPQGNPAWQQTAQTLPPQQAAPVSQWGPPAAAPGSLGDSPFGGPAPTTGAQAPPQTTVQQQAPPPVQTQEAPQMPTADNSVYEQEYAGKSVPELQQELNRVSSLMVNGQPGQVPDALPRLGWLQAQINGK
jgi:hypothetical protein